MRPTVIYSAASQGGFQRPLQQRRQRWKGDPWCDILNVGFGDAETRTTNTYVVGRVATDLQADEVRLALKGRRLRCDS